MSWADYHTQSQIYASDAERALKQGNIDDATALYKQAAEFETQALSYLNHGKARTLGITSVSAASLWFKAGNFQNAKKTAHSALADDSMPQFAVNQLQHILQVIWAKEAYEQSQVEASDLFLTMSGGVVGYGIAPLNQVLEITEEISQPTNLTLRGTLRGLQLDQQWFELSTSDGLIRVEQVRNLDDQQLLQMVNKMVIVKAIRDDDKFNFQSITLDESSKSS
jgi:hypothetical protein